MYALAGEGRWERLGGGRGVKLEEISRNKCIMKTFHKTIIICLKDDKCIE